MLQEKKESAIGWINGRLEIKGKRYIYFFEIKHFVRIFLALVLLVAAGVYCISLVFDDRVEIVWQNGEVFQLDEQAKSLQQQQESEFSPFDTLTVESIKDKKKQPQKQTGYPENTSVVLRYSESITAILSEGATIKQEITPEGTSHFSLAGTVYLTISPVAETSTFPIIINNISLETSGGTIMHYVEEGKSKLSLIEGDLLVSPNQKNFIKVNDDQVFVAGKIKLDNQQAVVFQEDFLAINKATDFVDSVRQNSYLPGFDKKGIYQSAGSAYLAEGEYQLVRHGYTYEIRERTIPVMHGDKLINSSEDTILLTTNYGDLIRLYSQSEIRLPDPTEEEKKPPLLMTVSAQTAFSGKEKSFVIKGRVRVKVNKLKRRRVSFKSSVALVGVKGTDFEINASDSGTETLVVTGTVSLSDLDETKTVDIERGFMSSIGADGAPVTPVVIPPDRFKNLLQESFDSKEKPELLSKDLDLNRLTIKKGKSVVFQWSKSLQAANIVLPEKSYPLDVEENSDNVTLTRETVSDMVAGKYAARLEAQDVNGNWGEADIQFSILPEKSLDFFCDPNKANFNKSEIDAIKAFQKETNIKVDGIIGPETRGKIQEMLNCEMN